MTFPLSNERIAEVLKCSPTNVAIYWPLILQCLDGLGIYSQDVAIAVLATIHVECPPFKPVKEYGGDVYLNRMYDTRTDLGNTPGADGDGALYAGRGFIQITGKANYQKYGHLLGIDLIADSAADRTDPDKALLPPVAASILVAYFYEHRIHDAANSHDWKKVRRLVNGGYNGLAAFLACVADLTNAIAREERAAATA